MTATRRIDLKAVLQHTVSNGYGDLVTRRTGAAVRGGIEPLLEEIDGNQVAIMDFGTVRCLDISCADEIVGKLLLAYGDVLPFVLVGLDAGHRDAIEPVLERHGLAVVAEDRAGGVHLLGVLPEAARRAFGVLADVGRAAPDEIAARLSVSVRDAQAALDELRSRHLVREEGAVYHPLRCA